MIKLKNLLNEQGAGDTAAVRGLIHMVSDADSRYDQSLKDEAIEYMLQATGANPDTLRMALRQLSAPEQFEIQKAVFDILKGSTSASTDSDSNNNGYPDETESDIEAARAARGYGQGRYQGD